MPREGDIVSQYTLVRKIGSGGMGAVYEAVHSKIRSKRAAVKILHQDFANDPSTIARFEREAEAAAAIGHEGIVDIYDLGVSADNSPYMVMEFLEGRSLAEELRRYQGTGSFLDENMTIFVACNVLSALTAAHRAGVIHRDLKPDNIFLVDTGADLPRVKLLDFGIARMKELGGSESELTLTSTGMIMGTPYFMSPEQALGYRDKIDERTDLWSLGVILYTCVAGCYPFTGDNYNQVMAQIISDFRPADPRELNPMVSPMLESVIQRAITKDVGRRYVSAAEMLEDLKPLADEATLSVLTLSGRREPHRLESRDLDTIPQGQQSPFLQQTEITPSSAQLVTPQTHFVTPSASQPVQMMATSVIERRPPVGRRYWPLFLIAGLTLVVGFFGTLALFWASMSSDGFEPAAAESPPTATPTVPEPPPPATEAPAVAEPVLSAKAAPLPASATPPDPEPVEPVPTPVKLGGGVVQSDEEPAAESPPEKQPAKERSSSRRRAEERRERARSERHEERREPAPVRSDPPPRYGTKIPIGGRPNRLRGYGTKI